MVVGEDDICGVQREAGSLEKQDGVDEAPRVFLRAGVAETWITYDNLDTQCIILLTLLCLPWWQVGVYSETLTSALSQFTGLMLVSLEWTYRSPAIVVAFAFDAFVNHLLIRVILAQSDSQFSSNR